MNYGIFDVKKRSFDIIEFFLASSIINTNLNILVLVVKKNHYGKTADNDALKDKQNCPQHPIEGDYTW